MQLVSLQAETIEPVLQNRIVDIVLLERLALRMDERRTGRGPQVDEFGQVPDIELDQVLRRPSCDLFRGHDAILELCLQIFLPGIRFSHEAVEQDQVAGLRYVGDFDVRVPLERQEEMRGLRVHDELATDRLSRLEERTYPVHVAPRKGDDCELLLQRREEANGVLLHVGLGQRAPRIVRRDPRAFRDQDDRFRRGRRGDKVLRQDLLRSVVTEVPGVRDRPLACMHEVAVRRRGAVVDVDGFDIEAVDGLGLARAKRLVRVRPELQDRRSRGRIERLEDGPRALPQMDGDVWVDEPKLLGVVVVDVGDEDRREGGRFPGHVGWVEGFRGIESRNPPQEIQREVVPEAEAISRLEELDEVLLAEVERRAHVEPDSRIAILDEDFVPADLADAAIEREVRHGTPRVRGQSASCTTITSRTAFIDRKLRVRRPSGSVLKRRVSTGSPGVTRSDGVRPGFVSTRKAARMPRICPSSVMTVFPRSALAKTFIPAAARILRSLFFLSGLRGDDIEAKPSELEPNEFVKRGTALSYRAGSVSLAPQRRFLTWTISSSNAALSSASSLPPSRRTTERRTASSSGTAGPGSCASVPAR